MWLDIDIRWHVHCPLCSISELEADLGN